MTMGTPPQRLASSERGRPEAPVQVVVSCALAALADARPARVTILRGLAARDRSHANQVRDLLREQGVQASVLPITAAAWTAPRSDDVGEGAELVIDASGGRTLHAAQYAALTLRPMLSVPARTGAAPRHREPALYLGREIDSPSHDLLDSAAMLVQDIALRQVTIEATGAAPIQVRCHDLSEPVAVDEPAEEVMDVSVTTGSVLTLHCDREFVRADLVSSGRTCTWWTDRLVVQAIEDGQVLTFDSAVHLGMTGPLVIGRLDHLG